jgi:hypothetical protein
MKDYEEESKRCQDPFISTSSVSRRLVFIKGALGYRMVRVTDYFLDCVAFLCVRREPRGTAFFVDVPDMTRPSVMYTYLVTARHNLEQAKTDEIHARVNTLTSFRDMPVHRNDWHVHDHADVAAVLFKDPEESEKQKEQDQLRFECVPTSVFVGTEFFYHYHVVVPDLGPVDFPVSIGTEIFVPGLFFVEPGKKRNLPVARFGHVSRKPTEPIILGEKNRSFEQLAYLAEFRSWGGQSGSPVFCIFRQTPKNMLPDFYIAFLGLVYGHFDIKSGKVDDLPDTNSGIGIVTPAEFVSGLLYREDLLKEREELGKKIDAERPIGTPDSGV